MPTETMTWAAWLDSLYATGRGASIAYRAAVRAWLLSGASLDALVVA